MKPTHRSDAVDPSEDSNTGKLSTRAKESSSPSSSEPLAASSTPALKTAVKALPGLRESDGYEGDLISRDDVLALMDDSAASTPAWEPQLKALIETWRKRRRVIADAGLANAGKNRGIEAAGICGALELCADELEALLPDSLKE